MEAFRVEVVVAKDGTLTIERVPFPAGDKVEVTVRGQDRSSDRNHRYPLRGKPFRYVEPFKPVAESDWSTLK